MKNKKGFTLIELLVVIAILAILAIVATPRIIELFENAKKDSFTVEIKYVFRAAEQAYFTKGKSEFSNEESLGLPKLNLDDSNGIKYYVKMNSTGKVETIKATNGTYQYESNSSPKPDTIKAENIETIKEVTQNSGHVVVIERDVTYTVTFYNEDGTVYEAKTVKAGKTAEPSATPTKDTGYYTYAFKAWATEQNGTTTANLANVNSDMSVYATFYATKLKIFYINGKRCTFTDKIGGSINSTWGYYIDFCHMPDGYGGAEVGSCPKNDYISSNNTYLYLNNITNYLYDAGMSKIVATNTIIAGNQYGDAEHAPSYCFLAGTKVYAENEYKNIEDIKIGDKVWSLNEKTNKVELSTVTNTMTHTEKDIYELRIDDEIIYTTKNHPFYIKEKGWTKVENITTNDYVRNINNEYSRILSKDLSKKYINQKVYNITVDNNHTYYISENRYLVHNKPS